MLFTPPVSDVLEEDHDHDKLTPITKGAFQKMQIRLNPGLDGCDMMYLINSVILSI